MNILELYEFGSVSFGKSISVLESFITDVCCLHSALCITICQVCCFYQRGHELSGNTPELILASYGNISVQIYVLVLSLQFIVLFLFYFIVPDHQ